MSAEPTMSAEPPVTPVLARVLKTLGFVNIIGFLTMCMISGPEEFRHYDEASDEAKEILLLTKASLYSLGLHIARELGIKVDRRNLPPAFRFLWQSSGVQKICDLCFLQKFLADPKIRKLKREKDPFTMEIEQLLKRAVYEVKKVRHIGNPLAREREEVRERNVYEYRLRFNLRPQAHEELKSEAREELERKKHAGIEPSERDVFEYKYLSSDFTPPMEYMIRVYQLDRFVEEKLQRKIDDILEREARE